MWSGPRNISTAMMRAWENRADTAVMDEPFYAAFLAETGKAHPMRAAVLAAHETDWEAAARACEAEGPPILYQKHITTHMVARAPTAWMAACRHAFLIRPPEAVVPSFLAGWPDAGAEDLGFARQAALFERVADREGRAPPVIAAGTVLDGPEAALRALCAALGVAFDPAMLAWPPGRRATDGVWGAHWYKGVEASTGFARPDRAPHPEPDARARAMIAACRPHYERLAAHAIRPRDRGIEGAPRDAP